MKKITTIICSLFIGCAALMAETVQLGYTTGLCARDNVYRVGTSEKQGQAIRIGKEKLSNLSGCKITGIAATFASKRTTGGTVDIFIANSLGGEPIMTKKCAIDRATTWLTMQFDEPYVITGNEEEIYVGFTGEINPVSNLLMGDYTTDMPNCNFAFGDGAWGDVFGLGCGSVNVRAIVDGVEPFTDVMMKPITLDGYYKCGNGYSYSGQLFNFGTEPVTSLTLSVKVGNAYQKTLDYDGINIAPNAVFDFTLDEFVAQEEGNVEISIGAVKVNGSNDADMSDNLYSAEAYYYPSNMERALLYEGFTGQACGNCPRGHSNLKDFLESGIDVPVVELMHHAGYSPDFFTMESDLDCTFFYGSPNTYAPAFMINRTMIPLYGTAPVIEVSPKNLKAAYDYVISAQPYASLSLDTDYDPATRKAKVTLRMLMHRDMPTEQTIMNVYLTQNNIEAYQSGGGSNYIHNHVSRGTLTENTWGLLLEPEQTKAGRKAVWTHEFTLPETIHSDYYGADQTRYDIATDPQNMSIVAYIGSFGGDDYNAHQIYNCVTAKLGDDYSQGGFVSGISDAVMSAPEIAVWADGRSIAVAGDYDSFEIYDLLGHKVANGELAAGVYVVRVNCNGVAVTKKVGVK